MNNSMLSVEILFDKNNENFIIHDLKNDNKRNYKNQNEIIKDLINPPNNIKPIGSAFCEILNNSKKIICILNIFKEECNRAMKSKSNEEVVVAILKEFNQLSDNLIKISPYLKIMDIEIRRCWERIQEHYNFITNKEKIYKDVKEDILNEFNSFEEENRNIIDNFVNLTIFNVSNYIELIYENMSKRNMFYLPENDITTIHLTTCSVKYVPKKEREDIDIQHKKLDTQKSDEQYSYRIDKLNELLDVSFYQILHNGFHIRKCIVCKKLFADKTNSLACNNPSPTNPEKTCRELNRKEYNEDIGILEYQHRKISQYFRDKMNNKNVSNKEKIIIKKNFELYKDIVKSMKKKIKDFSNSKKYDEYLEYYEEYLKEIEFLIYKKKDFNIKDLSHNYLEKFSK